MTINKVTMFSISCDWHDPWVCHNRTENVSDFVAYPDPETAIEADDWTELDSKHYCAAHLINECEECEITKLDVLYRDDTDLFLCNECETQAT